jgi:hypothetical protein
MKRRWNTKMSWLKFNTLGSIALFWCALSCGQSAPVVQPDDVTEARVRISGTAVNEITGALLNQARITLTDTADQTNVSSVLTTENGRFTFTALKRGKFSLHGAKRGFIRTFYEQHEQFSTAIVTDPGLDTENLRMRLMPMAQLSGKVIDESGESVRQASVTLYAEIHQAGVERITAFDTDITDDQGYYEFSGLTPGNYFVSVAAQPWYATRSFPGAVRANGSPSSMAPNLDVAYSTTYNNGATDSDAASAIPVHGGEHVQADIHLNPIPVLHLIFRMPENPQRGISAPVFEKRSFDAVEAIQGAGIQQLSPGVFEITGVPAGKYTVRTQNEQTGQMQQAAEINLARDGQELDITQSEPGATVRFSVEMPNNRPLPKQLFIGLQPMHGRPVGFFPVDAAGRVAFEEVPAGKYTIMAFAVDNRYSVTRAVAAGNEISAREFTVTPGSSLDATIYLTEGVVTVEGFVKRGSKPASGVMVALVPKNPQIHGDVFRRDQSDSDGSFVLRGVIPGTYTLVAVEDAWGFAWNQPEVLNRYIQHGQNLTVGALMTNTVHLPEGVQVQPR